MTQETNLKKNSPSVDELLEHLRKLEILLYVAHKSELDHQIARQLSDKNLPLDYKMELTKHTFDLLKTIYKPKETISFLEAN